MLLARGERLNVQVRTTVFDLFSRIFEHIRCVFSFFLLVFLIYLVKIEKNCCLFISIPKFDYLIDSTPFSYIQSARKMKPVIFQKIEQTIVNYAPNQHSQRVRVKNYLNICFKNKNNTQFEQYKIMQKQGQQQSKIKKQTIIKLTIGSILYFLSIVLLQFMVTPSHGSILHSLRNQFQASCLVVFVLATIGWTIAGIVRMLGVDTGAKIVSSSLNNLRIRAVWVFISAITFINAIFVIGVPATLLLKSCSIIPTILKSVNKTPTNNQTTKLRNKQIFSIILFSVLAITYALMFSYFVQQRIYGMILMLISFLSDRVLPQLTQIKEDQLIALSQREIDQVEAFGEVCKIVFVSSIACLTVGTKADVIGFLATNVGFIGQLIAFGVLASFGQVLFLSVQNQIPQYILSTAVSLRDLSACLLSNIVFQHELNITQIICLLIFFFNLAYNYKNQEFLYYCQLQINHKKKFCISFMEEPIFNPQECQVSKISKSILGVEVQLPEQTVLDKEWNQRYQVSKMTEEIFPPHNILSYLGKFDDDLNGGWMVDQYPNTCYHGFKSSQQKITQKSGSTEQSKSREGDKTDDFEQQKIIFTNREVRTF